ncbi:ABC transporter permease [Fodinicurvata sediminis]|uniref:ABC transporter permease n=1 Tax=Fodinicurvata sediminis TaxID=1121832 RepID=UPI0003B5EDCE|nr:ABC transporter permease [Fodinicurvata sediminis]
MGASQSNSQQSPLNSRQGQSGTADEKPHGLLYRFFDSDIWHSFSHSPITVLSAIITLLFFLAAIFAPLIAPYTPFHAGSLHLMDGFTPPFEEGMSGNFYVFGTDDQGRDVFSAIIYGARISLLVGFCAVLFAMVLGVTLGLIAGYRGGWVDTIIMRIADVQLSFPAILVALLIFGLAKAMIPREYQENMAIYVLIISIGLSDWVQYARTVRGTTMVEKNREYVLAARVIGVRPAVILFRHVLPNVMGSVLVIATIGLALAIIAEATLSFLGVGVPPTTPSLGTLIRIGNDFLFSGEWWITIFPGIALIMLALSVNLLGDWLRDALNPKLR